LSVTMIREEIIYGRVVGLLPWLRRVDVTTGRIGAPQGYRR
jgi:hypothetical protein